MVFSVQLFAFYTVFYTSLGAFTLAYFSLYFRTVRLDVPRYYGNDSIVGISPGVADTLCSIGEDLPMSISGVAFQPFLVQGLAENPKWMRIKFNVMDPRSYGKYEEVLDTFFAKYMNTLGTRNCSMNESNSDDLWNLGPALPVSLTAIIYAFIRHVASRWSRLNQMAVTRTLRMDSRLGSHASLCL